MTASADGMDGEISLGIARALPEVAEHQSAEAFGLLVAAELAVGRDRERVLVLRPLDEKAGRVALELRAGEVELLLGESILLLGERDLLGRVLAGAQLDERLREVGDMIFAVTMLQPTPAALPPAAEARVCETSARRRMRSAWAWSSSQSR